MEMWKPSKSFLEGITIILLIAGLLMLTEASLNSSKRIQFQQMQNQILRDHLSSLFIADITACAYVCIKDETCLSFSYQEETQQCLISSAFPEVAENEDANRPLVFMKVEDRLFQGLDSCFERHNLVLSVIDTRRLASETISFENCAEVCVEDYTCYGFTYHPLTAQCDLLMNSPADFTEAETGPIEELQYLIHRVKQNIAKDKPASQSTNHWFFTDATADLAVNGIDTDMSLTGKEKQPYWMVDLGLSYLVVAVKIHIPSYRYIHYPYIYVGETGEITYLSQHTDSRNYLNHPICGSEEESINGGFIEFTCTQPLLGRYVFVDSYFSGRSHSLALAEVEVFKHCNSNN